MDHCCGWTFWDTLKAGEDAEANDHDKYMFLDTCEIIVSTSLLLQKLC